MPDEFKDKKDNDTKYDVFEGFGITLYDNDTKFGLIPGQVSGQILKYYQNVVLINDIEPSNDNIFFKKEYNWYDFNKQEGEKKDSKVLYLENIDGLDMFNTIKLSKKTIACHGTITLLGNLTKVPILDIFYCKIKNKNDYHRYKNSFHEHKPYDNNYDFIIPRTNINKTIRKMKFSLKK